jgi:peptidoglycan L-alanyl-D-glutamate endopeptidase CwlK
MLKLSDKRISFSEKVTHLELELIAEGIPFARDWCKRSVSTQAKFVNEGSSRTMRSLHLNALAQDYILYDEMGKYIKDGDHPYYKLLGKKAKELGLKWGGDFKGFNDAGHVEWSEE